MPWVAVEMYPAIDRFGDPARVSRPKLFFSRVEMRLDTTTPP